MTWQPVAKIIARPAVLPAFDPSWSTPCMRCSNRHGTVSSGLRCKLMPLAQSRNGYLHGYCITARDPGGICGPDAVLFVEAA